MAFVVARIVAGEYPAQRLPIPQDKELSRIAVQVERVFAAIEKFLDLEDQGRDPMRIIFINAPGNTNKVVQIGTCCELLEFPTVPRPICRF